MNEDKIKLLTLDLRPVPDTRIRSGAIFEHVQRSPQPSRPCRSVAAHCRSISDHCRSNSRLSPIRERIVAQWNGGITVQLPALGLHSWTAMGTLTGNHHIDYYTLRYIHVPYHFRHCSLLGLTQIPAWISNHMSTKVWDAITYTFLNLSSTTVEV